MTPETSELDMTDLDIALQDEARRIRRQFLSAIEPHRPALFAYCRGLTANVWDAEDLVQETLAKAFSRAAESHYPIQNPMGFLVRVATNTFIDTTRRAQALSLPELDPPAPPEADPIEVRDALEELIRLLPPQERAVIVLKDVFDYPLADIASVVGTSTGAVKSALHRGRAALADDDRARRLASRTQPDRAVLDAAAKAFSAYDIDALVSLFREDAVMNLVGMVYETGPEQMRGGTFEHTFVRETDVRYSAEVRDFDGEPILVVWSRDSHGEGAPGVCEVWRCTTEEGLLTHVSDHFFTPEVVTEIAEWWGLPTCLHGYRYS